MHTEILTFKSHHVINISISVSGYCISICSGSCDVYSFFVQTAGISEAHKNDTTGLLLQAVKWQHDIIDMARPAHLE